MTIAVAKFTAPSAPVPGNAAPAAAGGDQPLPGDFASLLLGQMLPGLETALSDASSGALPGDASSERPDDGSIVAGDPAQLFASLGLPVPLPNSTTATPSGPTGRTFSDAAADGKIGALAENGASSLARMIDDTAVQAQAPSISASETANPTVLPAKLAVPVAGEEFLPASTVSEAPVQATAMGAASAHPTAAPARHAAQDTALQVPTPVRDAAWPADFSQKVVWMARQELQSAQITLNPPQMGPIEISLDIRNDQASATFVSANPEVREAIESALPRLREMLAGAGIDLGQAQVSQESFRQASGSQDDSGRRKGNDSDGGNGADVLPLAAASGRTGSARAGNGLVDTFA
jgi:flagellar hook-length control protein FliK